MDNKEELIAAELQESNFDKACSFRIGDTVWFSTERCYGVIEDKGVDIRTNIPYYTIRTTPNRVCSFIPEHFLKKSRTLASALHCSPIIAF